MKVYIVCYNDREGNPRQEAFTNKRKAAKRANEFDPDQCAIIIDRNFSINREGILKAAEFQI